jgi:hypothetical protein
MHTVDFTLGNNFPPYTGFKYGLHDKGEPNMIHLLLESKMWIPCFSLCNAQTTRQIGIISRTYGFAICWQQTNSFFGHITFTLYKKLTSEKYGLDSCSTNCANQKIMSKLYSCTVHKHEAWSPKNFSCLGCVKSSCNYNNLIWLPDHE